MLETERPRAKGHSSQCALPSSLHSRLANKKDQLVPCSGSTSGYGWRARAQGLHTSTIDFTSALNHPEFRIIYLHKSPISCAILRAEQPLPANPKKAPPLPHPKAEGPSSGPDQILPPHPTPIPSLFRAVVPWGPSSHSRSDDRAHPRSTQENESGSKV